MCREDELDSVAEQRAQCLEDSLRRDALRYPRDRELEARAAVDERVAGDERPAAVDPEHEVVRLLPGNAATPTGSRSPAENTCPSTGFGSGGSGGGT